MSIPLVSVPPVQKNKDEINQVTPRVKVKQALRINIFINIFISNATLLSCIYNPYCHRKLALSHLKLRKFREPYIKEIKEPYTDWKKMKVHNEGGYVPAINELV